MLACTGRACYFRCISVWLSISYPPGKPEKLRTNHFADIGCPFLVLQGERDTFGTREELATMLMPEQTEYCWLPDGDHSLKPRKKSGVSEAQNRGRLQYKVLCAL